MSKGSEKIRLRSRRRFESAIERLRSNRGTHPLHIGKSIAITISAVAREARLGRTTLHRFPDLCQQIRALRTQSGTRERPSLSSAVRQKASMRDEIGELKTRIGKLIEQNLLLTMRLAQYEEPAGSNIVPMRSRKAKA